MKQLIAKSLTLAGRALLHILPEASTYNEPTELDLFSMAAIEVMCTDTYQGLPDAKKLQFQSAMTSALGVFFAEDAGEEQQKVNELQEA